MNRFLLFCVCTVLFVGCGEVAKDAGAGGDGIGYEDNRTPIQVVSDSIASDSTNASLYIMRAQMCLQDEQIGNAIHDINKALSLDRNNVDALLVLADIYLALGDQDNILATLTKASDIAPYDVRPMVKLSEFYFIQGNMQLSKAYADKALDVNNFNPRAYFMRGMVYLSKNDTASALSNFMMSRNQDDNYYDPLIEIAQINAAMRNPIADDFFKEAIANFPDVHSTYYDYALYLQDNGKPLEAIALYDTLISIYPQESRFYYNKGYVYLVYLFDYQKALDCFDHSIDIRPTIDAFYNKGRTLEQMGNFAAAKDTYLKILQTEPNYQLALDALQRLE